MTADIRYRNRYIINNTSSLVISFDVGDYIALRSVLGIPRLLVMSTVVDLIKGKLVCLELNQIFMLQLDNSGKGLSNGATYDTSFATAHISVFLLIYYPYPHPISILPLIEQLLLYIQVTLSISIILSKAVSRASWCIIHHKSNIWNDLRIEGLIIFLRVYFLRHRFLFSY